MGETQQPAVPSGIQKTRSVMWAQEAELVWSCWRGKCCLVLKPSATYNCSEVGCSSPKKLSSLLTQRLFSILSSVRMQMTPTPLSMDGWQYAVFDSLTCWLMHIHIIRYAFLPSNNCFSFKMFSSIMSKRLSSAVMAIPVMIVLFKRWSFVLPA